MRSKPLNGLQFGLLYFGLGVGFLILAIGCAQTFLGANSKSWPSVEGKSHWRSPHTWGYDYTVNGVGYYSTREDYGERKAKRGTAKRQHLQSLYPEGAPLKVYYWPAHPSFAVLKPGMGSALWLFFVAGGFFCTFTGIQIWYWKKVARQQAPS